MTPATFEALLSPNGQAALSAAAALQPTEATFLACLTRLQKQFEVELSKAAIATVILRQKARAKFSKAEQMYFTREALEQASGETIARYRAARFVTTERIGDWGCGIGGDSIALAEKHQIIAVELEAVRLAMAEQNLTVYGVKTNAHFIQADVAQLPVPQLEALFFDPGRRIAGRRKVSVENYQPPLSLIKTWLPQLQMLGAKISPAVALREIAGYDCEVEFISVAGELKECVLWFGASKTAARRATLLPGGHTLTPHEEMKRISKPCAYLYEPDPAILRAGLVATLAAQLDAAQIDEDIAYLTNAHLVPTAFARAFTITEAFPFNQKKLRERLRSLQVGQVTVKKRGSPVQPEALARQLKLSGPNHCVVFLTQVHGAPFVLLGEAV